MKRVLLWLFITALLAALVRVAVLTGENKHDFYVETYVKNIHYGGMDGIITTFAVVSGGEGASLTPRVTLVMGFASLFADAISMGVGEYVSAQAEVEVAKSSDKRKGGRRQQLLSALHKGGFDKEQVHEIARVVEANTTLLQHSSRATELSQEYGESVTPFKQGVVTFAAFIMFGSVPLLAYANQAPKLQKSVPRMFIAAVVLTGVTLFALGTVKALVDVDESWWMAGLRMAVFGEFAAAAAYFIGWFFEHMLLDQSNKDTSTAATATVPTTAPTPLSTATNSGVHRHTRPEPLSPAAGSSKRSSSRGARARNTSTRGTALPGDR